MAGILLVHAHGGIPLEFALPRVAARAETHLLALAPLRDERRERLADCASVARCWPDPPHGPELADLIVDRARAVAADAILGLSAPVLPAVAIAARRLGRAGAGPAIRASTGTVGSPVAEVTPGDALAWYDQPGYDGRASVEGLVVDGVFHPICMTGRTPAIPPATVTGLLSPCRLPGPLQWVVEKAVRRAVDALELENCATHTEVALRADGSVVIIDSVAGIGGWMIARQLATVFGVDIIGMLTSQLLGEPVDPPEQLLTAGHAAAASVPVIAADSHGAPWPRPLAWDSRRLADVRLVSPGSTLEVVPELTIPDGTPVPRYDPATGAGAIAGMLFLTAPDCDTLLTDCRSARDGLAAVLA